MATGFPVKANYATGDVLTAANMNDLSGTVNYLQYMPPRNSIINSNFSVWQRSTSATFAGTVAYPAADRWYGVSLGSSPTCTMSRQTADSTNATYAMRFGRNSGQTATGDIYVGNTFESINSKPLAGQTVILSFYAKKGADAPATLNCQIRTGTGTDQSSATLFSTGWTGGVNNNQNNTITTTLTRYTYSVTLPSTVNQIMVAFTYASTGTAGANEWFQIENVQLELGSVANTYMPNQPTYQGELAACQRYYQVIGGTASQFPMITGYASAASQSPRFPISYPVQMRTAPNITKNGTWATGNCGQPSAVYINNQGFSIEVSSSAAGQCYVYPDSSDDNFTLSAEL